MTSATLVCPSCRMPTRADAELCTSCGAGRPVQGWPTAASLGPDVGERTRSLVTRQVAGGFVVSSLLHVDPGRWLYQVVREDDPSAHPLHMVVIEEEADVSSGMRSLLGGLDGRIGVRAPSLQRVFATGRLDPERIWAVVDPVEESSLQDLLAFGTVPLGRTLHLAVRLVELLRPLWEAGHVLGPLTPARVVLQPQWNGMDEVQVTSTWYVSPEGPAHDVSLYAAPEWRPGRNTRASDVFALGALLVRMLTGKPAFTRMERAAAVRNGEPPLWKRLELPIGEPLPSELESVLRDMLSYNPDARPTDPDALFDRLARLTESSATPTVSPLMLLEDVTDAPAPMRASKPVPRPTEPNPPPIASMAPSAHASGPTPWPGIEPVQPGTSSTPVSVTSYSAFGDDEGEDDELLEAPPPGIPPAVEAEPEPANNQGALWFGMAFVGTGVVAILLVLVVWLVLPPANGNNADGAGAPEPSTPALTSSTPPSAPVEDETTGTAEPDALEGEAMHTDEEPAEGETEPEVGAEPVQRDPPRQRQRRRTNAASESSSGTAADAPRSESEEPEPPTTTGTTRPSGPVELVAPGTPSDAPDPVDDDVDSDTEAAPASTGKPAPGSSDLKNPFGR